MISEVSLIKQQEIKVLKVRNVEFKHSPENLNNFFLCLWIIYIRPVSKLKNLNLFILKNLYKE